MKRLLRNQILLFFTLTISCKIIKGQCVYYKVEMEQKVNASKYIVLGEVVEKQTYIDATGGINTLNKLKVNAWLKGESAMDEVYVITLGGVYGNKATLVTPSLQLKTKQEYVLMLGDDNKEIDNKSFRVQKPTALQLVTYADEQGSFINKNNLYRNVLSEEITEEDLFARISTLTGKIAKKPSGEIYQPRESKTKELNRLTTLDNFSPTTTYAGTIIPGDNITITGSGFGASPGTVFFSNANDGGATSISGIASDIVSWADNSITVKVPTAAGTGLINVNGSFTSASPLNIDYSHLSVTSDFDGFGSATRQRYYFRDMNSLGGYTFTFKDDFITNTAAVAAFKRAVVTWRCNTFINWRLDQASTTNVFGADGVNIIMFDALPAGVLGRATSRFSGYANGSCTTTNTVWAAEEIDFQFSDPPFAGFAWEYGTALPLGSEFDFESVVVHELGHAHGLGHVIDPGVVMHYSLSNGQSVRTPSANDIAGANARMAYSTVATCLDPAIFSGDGPMVALDAMSCTALPVELTTFNGERVNTAANKLYWSTAQEINSYGFYVQRSKDGSDFYELSFIRSSGNSVVPLNYNFSDNNAGPYPWFYRLRMVDIDGRQNFSNTIFIDGDKTVKWKVWTNGNGDRIYLYGNVAANEGAVIKVFSSTGQQLINRRIQSGSDEITVDHLARGIYQYQLFYNGKIITGKLMLGNR